MSLKFFPSWLKSKAGIVGLASMIIAPAGAVAIRAQTQDDPASLVQTEASNSNAAAQSTDPGASNSDSTEIDQVENNGSTNSSVTIDNQTIEVPANGSVHKEIKTANGMTTIDITTQNSSSADSGSNSSQNSLHVSTRSTSTQKSEGQSVSN